jgi:putative oxidoreductase
MNNKLPNCLFFLRISVALVLVMWTVDKFVNPVHAATVFERFYMIKGMGGTIMMGIAIAEMVLIALFLVGRFKNITYLIVLIIHAVSTLSSFSKYLNPFEGYSLMFFAAWPMLAACYTLYVLRDEDTKFNL